jgi:methylmalonyl-CoA mutase
MNTNLLKILILYRPKQWKQKIQYELKGADYNETLVWNSPEDIMVKPLLKDEPIRLNKSGTKATEFKICQNIFVLMFKIIERAQDALNRGADSLRLLLKTKL